MGKMTRLPLLDSGECREVCRIVDALKPHWIPRSTEVPYYTLGAASYLDAAQDPQLYIRRARNYNPLLEASFGWLYEKLKRALRSHFDAPFVHAREAARAGFHIFGFHEAFKKPTASVHFDRQHEDIPWENPQELELLRPISFTLPVCLPACGGGLNTWDVTWEEYNGKSFLSPESIANSHSLHYVPYEEGVLMVHSGNLLHQIASNTDIQPEDRRITLQGHALSRNGVFQIYW